MPSPRNIALTIHELEVGEFYWVLMEAADDPAAMPGAAGAPGERTYVYTPLEAALQPYPSYSNALAAGVAMMRRLFGPDGTPGSL